ncbi:MAG: flagellin FliC, partial [Thermoleophilia bacterium]|nr:flagellin FliC [Thermoleophilia bacterium]
KGVQQAQRNAQDGISLVQTAEGSMQELHSIYHRARELAVQYQNGTNGPEALYAITTEVTQLSAEVDRMVGTANFNGIQLLNNPSAAPTSTIVLQVGSNQGETLTFNVADLTDPTTGLGASLTNFVNGTPNLTELDASLDVLSTMRGQFGAIQNRLEYTVNALGIYQENLMAAESRIRDTDMAQEMTNFTKMQILQQSGTAMLAQANMASQSVLSLLQG